MKDVVDRYTDLTGKMQMPPEWAMGFHQSAWGYHQNDIEQVTKTYREKNIPIDAVMLDIEWMDDYKNFYYGNNFPDPVGMSKKLHDSGFHYTTIIDPAIRVPDRVNRNMCLIPRELKKIFGLKIRTARTIWVKYGLGAFHPNPYSLTS